jgi:hypothetical protein
MPSLAEAGSATPQFDVQKTCRDTSNLGLADDQNFKTCMTDEVGEKKQLASKWKSYSPSTRSRCSEETTVGGVAPSYVELSTCLELDQNASGNNGTTNEAHRTILRAGSGR